MTGGPGGLLAATGFVFVSYAGVTKVAGVAEEIENPDRNIPLGILGSLAFTTLLYVALVVVMVGVVPGADLAGSNVPMALAAEATLETVGVVIVVVAAVIALVSTANAGILSSSRYPLAMSRDRLAPPSLSDISGRFHTPVQAITLTGAVLLVMVAFVPIAEIAKLASAFKIVVFVLVNLALVAFREADLDSYDPSFETPLYPLPQVVGSVGGVVLLPFMGLLPVVGAVLITGGSLLWYAVYVRGRTEVTREGVAVDALRQRLSSRLLSRTASVITDQDAYGVMAAVTERTTPERERTLLGVATAIAGARGGTVQVTRFDEVPDQVPLEIASERQTDADHSFEDRLRRYADDTDVHVEYEEVVSHDTRHAICNHARELGVEGLVLERRVEQLHEAVFGSDIEWIRRHAPCDVVEVEDRGFDLGSVETVAVVSDRGPYDARKVMIADALATAAGARVRLLFAVDPVAPARRRITIDEYLTDLAAQFSAPVLTELVETDDGAAGLTAAVRETDLLVISGGDAGLRGALLGRPAQRIVDGIDGTAVMVSAGEPRRGRLRRFLENRVF